MGKSMKTLLGNAIVGWYDNSLEKYKGLDDPAFIKKVCDEIGITEEFYSECVEERLDESNACLITEDMSSSDIFVNLSASQRDDIYRMVWSDHVAEDVKGRLSENPDLEMDEDEEDALCNEVANAYVYNGDYDCNLSYWDNIDNLIEEFLSKLSEKDSLMEAKADDALTASIGDEHQIKAEKRTRLTNEEYNAVTTWTLRTHFDSVMDIQTDEDGNDYWMDFENDIELSLEEGFKEMAEAVAYPFTHEGLTEEESELMMNLLKEFGVDEDMLDYIANLTE